MFTAYRALNLPDFGGISNLLQSLTVNNGQQDITILAYLFIPNQLYMFLTMSSPIIRST